MNSFFRNLCRTLRLPESGNETDGQLLERFLAGRGEEAFAALVERHGPMVLSTCRRILGDTHAAEDAFQATFLVLVRKAGSIVPRDMVGNWLYGVACRTARHVRGQLAKQRALEQAMRDMPYLQPITNHPDLRPILDAELEQLPTKFRASIVLCDLEGKSRQEAARQLGLAEGTLSSRLARGRDLLRARLTRRGLALPAGTVAAALAENAAPAAVPVHLLTTTIQTGALVAAGHSVAAVAPVSVAVLTEGVVKAMFMTKLKIAAALLLTLGLIGTGAGVLAHQALQPGPFGADEAVAAVVGAETRTVDPWLDDLLALKEEADKDEPKADKRSPGIQGNVVDVAKDGKRITLELGPKNKGESAQRLEIALTEKTAASYFNVSPNGAKPTPGYFASVVLADGSKDAAQVRFMNKLEGKTPTLAGEVVAVDGQRITVAIIEKANKGEKPEARQVQYEIGKEATVTYFGISKGAAKPTKGYFASIWLSADGKDVTSACFKVSDGAVDKSASKPERVGQLVSLDGERVTLELPPKVKGQEAERVTLKISNQTPITFHGVGPDGAAPAEGMAALVWLQQGSADTASRVQLQSHNHLKEKAPDVAGRLTAVADEGEQLTLEIPPVNKGEAPRKGDVHLSPKTRISYHGVGPDGAKPVVDYRVLVWLAPGSKDVAAEVRFETGKEGEKGKPEDKPKPAPEKGKPAPEDKPKAEPEKSKTAPDKGKPAPEDKPKTVPEKGKPAPEDKPKTEPEKDKLAPDDKAASADKAPEQPREEAKPEARPARAFLPIAVAVDREIDKRLAAGKVPAAPAADDAEFLRRVCLDITGRIPTLERTRAFLGSTDADKRHKLIDELLASPEFGQHMGGTWRRLVVPVGVPPGKGQGDSLTPWLAEQFNNNRGWDRIVTELLTAEGDVRSNPALGFALANGENGQPQANLQAAAASRLFLGVQLQCAECHDHPFTTWKQTDFWGTAAFFSRLRNGGNKGGPATLAETAAGTAAAPEKKPNGVGTRTAPDGAIVIPASAGKRAGTIVKARFLGGQELVLDEQPLRPRFAAWATSRENPYFARAFVNRTWGQFFGRGFVHPVDNFHEGNPPSHPELLDTLADEFKASGHDVKHLIRCVCNSKAYQRSSRPAEESEPELFAHMAVKPLSPEALYDSLALVLGDVSLAKPGAGKQPGNAKGVGLDGREAFVNQFRGASESAEPGELAHGIPQFLRRLNGAAFNRGAPLTQRLAGSDASREDAINTLYLATLSRRPTAKEQQLMTDYLAKRDNAAQGYAGVLWILINSGEFVLNH